MREGQAVWELTAENAKLKGRVMLHSEDNRILTAENAKLRETIEEQAALILEYCGRNGLAWAEKNESQAKRIAELEGVLVSWIEAWRSGKTREHNRTLMALSNTAKAILAARQKEKP